MEVAPAYWQDPQTLKDVYISTSGGPADRFANHQRAGRDRVITQATSVNSVAANAVRNLATNSIGATGKTASSTGTAVSTSRETMIPLSSIAHFGQDRDVADRQPQDGLVANTISFNLPTGVSLSTAVAAIETTMERIGVPAGIKGSFQGVAKIFQQSIRSEPFLDARGAGDDLYLARHAL